MSTVTASEVSIRQSKPEDVKLLMEFAEDFEWDLSMYDHLSYIKIDPNYLIVAADRNDEPVGFCGVSQNAPNTIYFGNFIVRKDLRKKGIGRLLWTAMLEKAGDQNIVLDGGPDMADWYIAHGFPFQAYKVQFCVVKVTSDMKQSIQSSYDTVTLTENMWPALMEYDRQVYPTFDRTRILRAWFSGELVRVAVAMKAGKIVGYGSIHRKPNNEYGLRNVFGDNEDVIEALLYNMLSGLPIGTVVHFMILEDKPLPKYIHHSVPVEETAIRMFNKVKIETNTDKIWLATAHIV
ncbi:uncharacterized protein LOC123558753 [Mercenaria mercenaria]|uniref:uncharacterized protein LOC123558753 n=1 Tax=Mercenaria mercenaria TaxID=6596 RepID=UPI00234EA8E0|nr:uncharacterized protein LOC123558753 [Mercenaria mercenaria]